MKIGESGCEAIRTEIVFELLPITVIFDSQKTKYLTLFPSSENSNLLYLITFKV